MIDFSGQRSTCRTSATGYRTSRPPIALMTPLPSETKNYLNLKRNNDVGNGRRWVTPEAVKRGRAYASQPRLDPAQPGGNMAEMIGSLKDEFPDKYLFAEDLHGKPVDVTIAAMNSDSLVTEGGKKRSVVVTFAGKKKVLVLNKTNAHLINEIFPLAPGESLKSWVGKRITIYPTQTKFKGEVVDCIRVYGSLDLPADKRVYVKQGFSKVAMTLHAVKAGADVKAAVQATRETIDRGAMALGKPFELDPQPATDVLDAWDILGWTTEERKSDSDKWPGGYNDPAYLSHLGALIDQMNAQEAS